jgi:MscS family membrane protein
LRTLTQSSPDVKGDEVYAGLGTFSAASANIEMLHFFRVDSYSEQVQAQHQLMIDIVTLAEDMDVDFAFPKRTAHGARDRGSPFVQLHRTRSTF